VASILFLGSQLLAGISISYGNAERAARAKKRYELARGGTKARTKAIENVESLRNQSSCWSDRLQSANYFDRRRGKLKVRE